MIKAIVINTIKYGENDLIAHCLLLEGGRTPFLLKDLFKRKKAIQPAYFQPLMQLNLVPSSTGNQRLKFLKSVSIAYHYQHLYTDPIKQSLLFFLSEFLQKTIPFEQETDQRLFEYISKSLQWLDIHEEVSNFHLIFMIKMTRYLGFYPDINNIDAPYFDLFSGKFKQQQTGHHCLNIPQTTSLKMLLQSDFETKQHFSDKEDLLNCLNHYLRLHLENYHPPKSTTILKSILR